MNMPYASSGNTGIEHSEREDSVLTMAELTRVFDSAQDSIVIFDLKAAEISWCSAVFANHFPAVVQGASLDELKNNFIGLDVCLDKLQSQSASHDNVSNRVIYSNKQTPLEINVTLFGKNKCILRVFDIAEREHITQRHLEDREQLLFTSRAISVGEMATTLAHELNQPFGTICNLIRGVRMRLDRAGGCSDDIFKALDQAIDQALFGAKIIARIRDYTHSRQPRREPINLVSLVDTCVTLIDWEIRRDGVVVEELLGSMPLPVMGDEVMLQQVFVNLLRNAIDAMRNNTPQARRLEIKAMLNDKRVEISISDSGCGLSTHAEKNLFVPFVSNKPTGMGVGLNICRSFIELHQGKLWFSRNADVGCTFYVALPVATP